MKPDYTISSPVRGAVILLFASASELHGLNGAIHQTREWSSTIYAAVRYIDLKTLRHRISRGLVAAEQKQPLHGHLKSRRLSML